MTGLPPPLDEWLTPPLRRRRRWRDRVRDALRGLKRGVRSHLSFHVLFFLAALASVAAVALGCSLVEWCLLAGCIGLVFTAELFYLALETICHPLDASHRNRPTPGLDIAGGALVAACLTALLIGGSIFLSRLWHPFLQ